MEAKILFMHTLAIKVAENVASGEFDRGVLLCGTGLGVSIAANKVKGAYAALVSDVYSATRARLSNDANIMCMGAFTTGNKVREAGGCIFYQMILYRAALLSLKWMHL